MNSETCCDDMMSSIFISIICLLIVYVIFPRVCKLWEGIFLESRCSIDDDHAVQVDKIRGVSISIFIRILLQLIIASEAMWCIGKQLVSLVLTSCERYDALQKNRISGTGVSFF